jgi:hypothetical protein
MRINPLILTIFIIFLIIGIVPGISAIQVKLTTAAPHKISNFDPYLSIPDWVSDNPHYSTGAALADFNKDGWLDLVISDGNDMALGKLNVYYNDKNGNLPTTASWQSDDFGYNGHLDVADVNGDGWPDVAVSYLGTSSSFGPIARVYLNNEGTLSSLPDWSSDITGNSFGVDFGDMNNDGRPDLAVATGWSYYPQYYYHNYVYINLGGTLESSASWASDDINTYMGTHWVDADDDGWLDLAYIGTYQETYIYENNGGVLETTASWHTMDSVNQDGIMLTSGDVNFDGIKDLFATDNTQLGGGGRFKQYTGLSDSFFETTYSWNYMEGLGSAVTLADVNCDDKLDLATGAWWDYTRIFINDGSGLPTNPTWTSGGTSVVEKIVFGNVGPIFNENTYEDNFPANGDRRLFYLLHQNIQKINSIKRDGITLDPSEYTYSREHSWITVDTAPSVSVLVNYNYSKSQDMVVSNWDDHIGNYLYYNQICQERIPDLECVGELSWEDVKPSSNVTGSFSVENVGDEGSELDWEVTDFPEWGNWTFTPISGSGLTPENGSLAVDVSVTAPSDINSEFTGRVKVINKDNTNDYCEIDIYLKTPRGKTQNHPVFSRIINRFPNAFPILQWLLQRFGK